MSSIKFALLVVFSAFLLSGPVSAQSGKAPKPTKVMIVLDASGSMRARIGRERKMDIARRVVRDLMRDWDASVQIGLSAYGHRRKGDCRDIQTLYPVGKADARRIMRTVNALRPKGKTPLSAAVKQAAEHLKYTEDPATVILISDGKETCQADPCAVGKALKEAGVNFKVHVIGFAVSRKEQVGLRCLAQNTGGLFVTARDARSLLAGLRQAVREVKVQQAKPAKPAPKPVVKDIGLKVVALYAEGGKEFEGQINWRIFNPKKDLAGKRKLVAKVHRGRSGQIFRDLQSGRYAVRAELSDHRHIVREFEIEVAAGEAAVRTVVLDIGKVRFDAKLAAGGAAFKGDLGWTVLSAKADLSGKRKKIANFWRKKSGGVFILPAGTWAVDGVLADSRYVTISEGITVVAGGEEAHEFIFNAGTVRFDARLNAGGPAFKGQLGWTVLSSKADLGGKKKKLTGFWRARSGATYILPAGTWQIQGVLADHRHVAISRDISVLPGSEQAHEFVFKAGAVRVEVTKEGAPYGGQVGWTVLTAKAVLGGKRAKVTSAWRVKSGRVVILAEGDYVVQALDPNNRKIDGEATLSVKAGDEKALVVDISLE